MADDILYEAKEFSYPNLKTISQTAFDLHKKLYEGYVKKLNEIIVEYKTVNKGAANHNYSHVRELLIEKSHNYNSMILHECFFNSLSNKPLPPSDYFKKAIEKDFITWGEYLMDLEATAMSSRAGWAVTIFNKKEQRFHNFALDLHDMHVPIQSDLIVVIDTWEHAYMVDFAINKADYVRSVIEEINWGKISERVERICCS
jgi:Fe-Mn family superoxide dismutase